MKKKLIILTVLSILAGVFPAEGKTVLGDLLKIYKTYQEINMTLWLTGDIGAEKRLGKELKMWMKLSHREEKDPKINAYVRKIFYRLLPHFNTRGMKFDVRVIKNNTANAFIIPGGHVYVHTGLLNVAKTDDELAAVISHELAHGERRHSLKNFRTSTVLVALLKRAIKNKKDQQTWGALLSALTLMKFSRKQEDEADDIGQFRMFNAGFNPAAQVTLWEKFLKKYGDTKGLKAYLSSHPPSSKRVENARNNLKKMKVKEVRTFTTTRNILVSKKQNLLKNPSFEKLKNNYPLTWEVSSGAGELNTKYAKTGLHSYRLDSKQRMNKTRLLSEFIPFNKNSNLQFSGWFRSLDGKQNLAIGVELFDKNKRLRHRIFNIRNSEAFYKQWTFFQGIIKNGVNGLEVKKNISFIRIVIQNGLLSTGPVWIDELRLKHTTTKDPVNLLPAGDFESANVNGRLLGISGYSFERDLNVKKTGYSSLKLNTGKSENSIFSFFPIPISKFDVNKAVNGSFHFFAKKEIKGKLVVEFLDSSQKLLSEKPLELDFIASGNSWKATSFIFDFNKKPAKKAADKKKDKKGNKKPAQKAKQKVKASYVVIRLISKIPEGSSLWFDDFILRQ
jgi:Zn-dependent protease with chaperone function